MPGPIFVRRDRPVMQPKEVRALRDEFGWTQEQLAAAAGVSALEVSAWEAGAVSVRLDDAAALAQAAWRERRERAWDAAGARPCAWGADARARIEGLRDDGDLDELDELDVLLRKHQEQCAACSRAAEVEQALPRVPALPLPLSLGGFIQLLFRTMLAGERLPGWRRLPVRLGIVGAWVVLVTLMLALLRFIVVPEAGFEFSFTPLLQLLSIVWCWVWAALLWDEVYSSQTSLARFLKAVTTAAVVIAMAMLGMDPIDQSGVGFLALVAVYMVRDHRGRKDADAQPVEQNALAAPGAAPDALPGSSVEPQVERKPRDTVAAGGP